MYLAEVVASAYPWTTFPFKSFKDIVGDDCDDSDPMWENEN